MPSQADGSITRDANWKRAFRRRLLAWYERHRRDLPWRKSDDPYRVWISEVMLQQTQVETVRPYFTRFVKAFPTVGRLAAAQEEDVLRLWEGLGYYRRARSLHAAARQIVADHGGVFPSDVPTLMQLPGVGRYTAGAIVSIAFDQRAPILEANTLRLFARLLAYREDPARSAGQRLLWQFAEELLPRQNVARFNQALMELGSLVCRPDDPPCSECPVCAQCEAFARGLQSKIPATKRKMEYTDVREAAVVVRKSGSVLIRQCVDGERWAGLWDFPRFELQGEGPLFVQNELRQKVQQQTGIAVEGVVHMRTIKHGVTRYRITLDCYEARFAAGRARSSRDRRIKWLPMRRLEELPLSTTGRQISRLITGG